MSYNDEKLGSLFPTRFGTPTGSSNERQMLDKTGADGIRKSYRTLADGSVVMCETRNGFPKFTLERKDKEVLVDIGMDSGVVDLVKASFVWSGAQDENTADGKLYATTFVSSYLAGAEINDDSPIINVISPPHTGGVPEPDGSVAKSFRKKVPNDYTALYQRKRVAALCPPSIFTGRMRLYVQALYGRHDALSTVSLNATVGTTTPSIDVAGITLHTSCGVYLDPATAKHFLLSVGSGSVTIYPLVSSACAEKLRPKLLDSSISAANKERIEAYILSQAYPASGGATVISITSISAGSMGYGWHFNWSGTACDIVYNTVVNSSSMSGGSENESTHYRLTFSKSAATWTIGLYVVEGPVRWKGQRHNHPITFPHWASSGLEKFGAHQGPEPYGDAPFYAFYKRDELQVCRYSVKSSVTAQHTSRFPAYYNPGGSLTQGTDALDYRKYLAWTGANTTISCGSAAISFVSAVFSATVLKHDSPQVQIPALNSVSWYRGSMAGSGTLRTPQGKYLPVQLNMINDEFEGPINVFTGVAGQTGADSGASPSSWVDYTFPDTPARTGFSVISPFPANWNSYEGTEYNQHTTAFITVVPFYDAEAVFLLGSKSEYRSESGTKWSKTGGGFFMASAVGGLFAEFPDTLLGVYEIMGADYGTITSTTAYSEEYPPVTTTSTLLSCSAGNLSGVTIPTPGAFFNPTYDIVPVMLPCYSSCNGALFSQQGAATLGVPAEVSLNDKPFTFVGWA